MNLMTTKVKERPILFTGPMVRAILDGRKTQTRRVVKWKVREPGLNLGFSGLEAGYYCTDNPKSGWVLRSRGAGGCWNDRTYPIHSRYGQIGDRLWVRETFANFSIGESGPMIAYKADGWKGAPSWKPSIHMPRTASRILLEVTGVRVERLLDITPEDATSEGVINLAPIVAFRDLWDSINAKRGFASDTNPWVWVIEFRGVNR